MRLNESPFIAIATSNVRPRFSLLQWTVFSTRYALRSKNQFSMEHVMQLSSLWGMSAIWDGHLLKLKARAFVMVITSLDPKKVLLDDTISLLVFKGSHLCFINTEIVSGRNKEESVSIPGTKWKFSASGDSGLRDNGQQVTGIVFWSCWPLSFGSYCYTWLNFIRFRGEEIRDTVRFMFSPNIVKALLFQMIECWKERCNKRTMEKLLLKIFCFLRCVSIFYRRRWWIV